MKKVERFYKNMALNYINSAKTEILENAWRGNLTLEIVTDFLKIEDKFQILRSDGYTGIELIKFISSNYDFFNKLYTITENDYFLCYIYDLKEYLNYNTNDFVFDYNLSFNTECLIDDELPF